jgi:hypothetical protein
MPHRRCCLAAALLAVGLAACDRGPATVTHYRHPSGGFDFLVAATRNRGALLVQVEGRPFGVAPDTETVVLTVLEEAVQSRVLRLTSDPGRAADPRFRLVLVFNPPQKGDILAFCRSTPRGGPPAAEGRVELRAGFCRGDDLLAGLDGWAEDAEGPDDPRFAQLLRQVGREAFSRRGGDD